MRIGSQEGIRVIRAGEDLAFFRSADARFSVGFWRRAPEEGPMAPPYHEIA